MRLYAPAWTHFWNAGRKVSLKSLMDTWRTNKGNSYLLVHTVHDNKHNLIQYDLKSQYPSSLYSLINNADFTAYTSISMKLWNCAFSNSFLIIYTL